MKTEEFYIITTAHKALWPGGVILFWAAERSGYSTFLEKAGRYSEADATDICKSSISQSFMVPCEEIESQAVRVVDIDKLPDFIGKGAARKVTR
jgi:hypothetical protein